MPQVGDIWESLPGQRVRPDHRRDREPRCQQGERACREGEVETIEQPDGGSNHVYKIAAAKVKFEPLTIERYVDGSPEDKRFQDWFRSVFDLNAKVAGRLGDPQERDDREAPQRREGDDVHVPARLDQVVEVHRPGSRIDRAAEADDRPRARGVGACRIAKRPRGVSSRSRCRSGTPTARDRPTAGSSCAR